MSVSKAFLSALAFCASSVLADLLGVPTVPYTAQSSGGGSLNLKTIDSIVIDSLHAGAKDTNGWTLIPPSLTEFANTFAKDFASVIGKNVSTHSSSSYPHSSSITLTIGNDTGFKDAAGRWTSEAYSLDVSTSGVRVIGASPLGVWWGTRSVLQQAVLDNGSIPIGKGTDAPGWGTRGVMLDAGRHYYPTEFVVEMCNWMSWWKMNTFHLHISDNLYNNVDIYSRERQLELYSAFRLWSEDPAVIGLNKRRNESYTREDFDFIQSSCAARGVTIIPEIEAPGHALVITQWKPELGIDEQLDLLNLSNPDATTQMESIWKTFLPWFHSKVVHIGADEYVDSHLSKDALAEVYNTFVNTMNEYIYKESGKSIRIWGTFPPQSNYTENIAKNVTIQHWEYFEDNPYYDYIKNGYDVINSDDAFYIVTKYSTSYPQILNKTRIFHGNPATNGPYAPYVFDINNATNNPPPNSPYVVGHLAAQWNDYGPNTSTYLEAYYSWAQYLPALADKQWGGKIGEAEYDRIYPTLQAATPAANLDRRIKSKGDTIVNYNFQSLGPAPYDKDGVKVRDHSGNGYDAKTKCSVAGGYVVLGKNCSVTTPLTSKGSDYTLSFTLRQTSNTTGPIFTGPDSALWSGIGSSTQLMLVSAGNAFALNWSLPVGEWVDGSLIGRGNRTFFAANGTGEMEFTTKVGVNGASFAWARMAVVAPLKMIGGGSWEGQLKSMKLVDHA